MNNHTLKAGLAVFATLCLSACTTASLETPQPITGPALSEIEAWTPEAWDAYQASEYAARRDVFETRDQEMFESDLQMVGMLDQLLGLTPVPSPVLPYNEHDGVNNCFVANMAIFDRADIGAQTLKLQGRTLAYADPTDAGSDTTYAVKFNLIYVTDQEDFGFAIGSSRNCPHYLSSGGIPTSTGALEWVQLTMMDGRSLAVIANRIFDLEQGRTILAVPMEDGSVRFRQIEMSNDYLTADDIAEAGNPGSKHQGFIRSLLADDAVTDFFLQEGAIESVLNPQIEAVLEQMGG